MDRLRDALQGHSFEIILVHDGGPDGSWPTISELARADHRVRGINLRKNFGQHNAIMAGLAHTRGEAIVTMDDDLQHSPKDIGALLRKLNEGYDVCYAAFKSRKHAAWKVAGSRINDYLATLLLGKPRGLYLFALQMFLESHPRRAHKIRWSIGLCRRLDFRRDRQHHFGGGGASRTTRRRWPLHAQEIRSPASSNVHGGLHCPFAPVLVP